MEKEIDQYNQNRAKEIIDCMFDSKIFKDSITRDDMNVFEDLLAFHFQCFTDIASKIEKFNLEYKNKKL